MLKYILALLIACVVKAQTLPVFYTTVQANRIPSLGNIEFIDINGPCMVAMKIPPSNNIGAFSRMTLYKYDNNTFNDITYVTNDIEMINPSAWYVGDMTGDGLQDMIVVGEGIDKYPSPGELVKILVQTPDGHLYDETLDRLPQNLLTAHGMAVADISRKGSLDILACCLSTGPDRGTRFYINDGNGYFSDSVDRLPVDIINTQIPSAAFVDVNGDGYPDLVLGSMPYGQNQILINDGTGHFYRDSKYTLPPKLLGNSVVVKIVAADLNGDGRTDLLLSCTSGTSTNPGGQTIMGYQQAALQVLIQQPDGTFIDKTADSGIAFDSVNDLWVTRIQVTDLNNDGIPDILLNVAGPNDWPGHAKVLLGTGNGRYVDESCLLSLTGYVYEAVDLNEDGCMDMVMANSLVTYTQIQTPTLNRNRLKMQPIHMHPLIQENITITSNKNLNKSFNNIK